MRRAIPSLAAMALLFGGLATLRGPSARAGPLTLGGGLLANQINLNEVNLSSGSSTQVGPTGSSTSANQPGSYNLLTPVSYTDTFISSSGSVQSSLTTQYNAPQIVQSGSDALTSTTLTPGWVNKSAVASNVFQGFTLTIPYNFQLREQATASTNSEGAFGGGELLGGPSGVVTSWFLSAPAGNVPVSTDMTVSGLLGPGSYTLFLGSEVISYSDPTHPGTGEFFGQQTLTLTPTPEPSTLTLLSIGLAGMAVYGWRRRKGAVK